jgi:hypothetical protein
MTQRALPFSGGFSPVRAAISFLWKAKSWLVAGTLLGGVVALWVIVAADRVYRAEAVLVPVDTNGTSIDAVSGSLGGIAALAGINIGGESNQRIALATLRGKEFTARFIRERGLLPLLFPERWDQQRREWRGSPPTMIQAVDRFDRGGLRKVIENRQSGLVTIQLDWTDSQQAVDWLVSMVAALNDQLREGTIAESRRSIEFLTAEADKTQSTSVRETIFRLIENEMKRAALASAQPEYALKFVDRPLVSEAEDYIWPRPVFLMGLGLLMGWLLGGLLFVAAEAFRGSRVTSAQRATGN